MHLWIEHVVDQDSSGAEVVDAIQRFRDAETRQVRAELGTVDVIQRQGQGFHRAGGCGANQGNHR
ncbi:hypothetical protein D3C80_2082090 [compost metagenome]